MRQVQRRVRRVRDLRASRGRQPHVPRPLCAAASRPGERRHRDRRRREAARRRAPWATSPTRSTSRRSATLPGHIAIGHTRYSTAGESKLENAQPFLIDCAHGQIAVGHNGNLVNARELRDELVRNGSIFQTSSDTEVILHLYARSKAPSVEEALVESIAQVRGAYSLVLLTKDRLIAARDPHGFRPLALGRLGDAWIVCSETCALDLIGAHVRARRRAGRAAGHQRRRRCGRSSRFPPAAARALRLRARLLRAARQLRVRPQRERGAHRARAHPRARGAGAADVVVPIPDSGVCAAIGFAEEAGLPMKMGLIRNHYVGRTFIQPQQSIRHFSVRVKLNPVRSILEGKRVVLVDDSIVRGHDEPQDREDGEGGRRARSAPAHQLPADDLPLLLRRRHAEPVGADRRDPHARRDPEVHRGRQPGLSEPRRTAPAPSGTSRRSYCTSCYTGVYPVAFPRNEQAYLQLALKASTSACRADRDAQSRLASCACSSLAPVGIAVSRRRRRAAGREAAAGRRAGRHR